LTLCVSCSSLTCQILYWELGRQKGKRHSLCPLSAEARHKNANIPSEGGYQGVGKIFSGHSKKRDSVWEQFLAEQALEGGFEGGMEWRVLTKDEGRRGEAWAGSA
jgi:hypothetical protein